MINQHSAALLAAEQKVQAYWESHQNVRTEMEKLKGKRIAEITAQLEKFRTDKAVAIVEEKNFGKMQAVLSFEKKRTAAASGNKNFFEIVKKEIAAAGKGGSAKASTANSKNAKTSAAATGSNAAAQFSGSQSNAAKDAAKQGTHQKTTTNDTATSTSTSSSSVEAAEKMKQLKKLPFLNETVADQETALALIAHQNLSNLLAVLHDMHVEGVESNRKKALLEHGVRMFLSQLDKDKLTGARASLKAKIAKREVDLAELERVYDMRMDHEKSKSGARGGGKRDGGGGGGENLEAEVAAEVQAMVEKKCAELLSGVQRELREMEQSALKGHDDKDLEAAQELLAKNQDRRDDDRKKAVLRKSLALSWRDWVEARELTAILEHTGAPLWFLSSGGGGGEAIVARVAVLLKQLCHRLLMLPRDIEAAGLATAATTSDSPSSPKARKSTSSTSKSKAACSSTSTTFDYTLKIPASVLGKKGGDPLAERSNSNKHEDDEDDGSQSRAAFLARHLKNTRQLQQCLDQGYKNRIKYNK
ncbi:unnamed protein product [Amoebophrya sp. A25]|nr:unnamed protein product [Amoebophrya sp. A25]|eukprot:GSA25T00019467001.1